MSGPSSQVLLEGQSLPSTTQYQLQLKNLRPSKKLQMATSFVIGADVGSRSVRAALVSMKGSIVRKAERPLEVREAKGEIFEQSGDQIWKSLCESVREVVSGVSVDSIKGIGFAATCSLVIVDSGGKPISVSGDGDDAFNVIMWCDHRALKEATTINSKEHTVLKNVGGKISPEMEPPKLLWLKSNLPTSFERIGHAFDLPDYLTYRASDSLTRSLCSLTCKWTYDAKTGWDSSFWSDIGLDELVKNPGMIGTDVKSPGNPISAGLSEKAAADLGLNAGTSVAASIIDAHAGVLGMLGVFAQGISSDLSSRLCLIAGTSTCHMLFNESEIFVPGVWGPYLDAVLPQMHLAEAGQSAAGMLIDHVTQSHSCYQKAADNARRFGLHTTEYLSQILDNMAASRGCPLDELTKTLHVYPDFHGNRSPLADPEMTGMVLGLRLSNTEEDLALLMLATVQSLAYSTLYIMDSLEAEGHKVESLVMCGGLIKNPLYVKMHANITQKPVLIPEEPEAVLLGSAVLAARASGCFDDLKESMREMSGRAVVHPADKTLAAYHGRKYMAYKCMLKAQLEIRGVMDGKTSHK